MSCCSLPGSLHAFYERTKGRRGHGRAIVATARKLAVLFWCMLTRGGDYAHQQPSLTKKKLRRLEITAGATKYVRSDSRGTWCANLAVRQAERELAAQAEASYKRMIGKRTLTTSDAASQPAIAVVAPLDAWRTSAFGGSDTVDRESR